MQIRLFLLVLVAVSQFVHGKTLLSTNSGIVFEMEFSKGKKIVREPELGPHFSLFQKQMILEDYLFLQFNLRAFCNPVPSQESSNETAACIRAYADLISFQKQGMDLSSLPGIYIAPSDMVDPNQVSPADPYSDIFGFVWIDGRNPLEFQKVQDRVNQRARFLVETNAAIQELSKSFGQSITLECAVEKPKCVGTLERLRGLSRQSYHRLQSASSWLKGFQIVPEGQKRISLGFKNIFSERVILIPTNVEVGEIESFILEQISQN